MTKKIIVNFKLRHFLLWIKKPYQIPNFETFKCSGESFPNSSGQFWKQKSIFLQILYQYALPSNITPLYFLNSNIVNFRQRQPIKVEVSEILKCSGQNSSNPSCLFWNESKFFFQFCIVFHVMTKKSLVNFKLRHFLLWIKKPYQIPNFETVKCSGESFPNSSCQFWKQKSIFLQILYQYSLPANITPLYFLNSNIIYFGQRQPIMVGIFEIFKCLGQNSSKSSCQFWNEK